ncbi:SDR family oxidoreductase [Conexibacter sp. JD483]|uniref:SDR family NAD(P)-dependent oxidoreductase n=1 Tax=unclassified Conexibacter TaxID=2627773 RepID=UPI002719333C|nr:MULTISPECIES: SDR family oxidoreductase [unclassified Conexibacter]MDO8187653.1 SDR family oxidoreductase [Conexibacter sp. CPCC 205706]MDO8199838.1 SDR family oxidoreductase [Conexibacter sp. CPCC 205762]MDR9370215.1 SDR family oxidoreductase [Conexibacter sp. JD483]
MLSLDLSGRTALVCGASRGIGRACAETLAAAGAHVICFARVPRQPAAADAERCLLVPGDLTDPADLDRLVGEIEQWGRGLDILVHNGGGPGDATTESVTRDELDEAIDLVLWPVVELTRRLLPALRRSGEGRVLSIGSPTFREVQDGRVLSNSLRPAVVGWLMTLAREVAADGITVNSIAPGRIETDSFKEYYANRSPEADLAAIPAGRFGVPADIANLVAFLSSARAAYLTGTVIPVDGGLMRSW